MARRSVFDMRFQDIYSALIQKAERKGRTIEEVKEVTAWLTGYSTEQIDAAMNSDITYGEFFSDTPAYNQRAALITGKICGIQIETIEDPLMKKIRQLDKLVDELAKGKPMESILCMKPQNIEEYIAVQDAQVQPRLKEVRDILAEALPEAEERISWSMPTFWKGRNIIHFAAAKKHIGLYPGDGAIEAFKKELAGFDVSKGTIRLPYDQELPADLIAGIARWCYEEYRK
jgi:hypothetical protein